MDSADGDNRATSRMSLSDLGKRRNIEPDQIEQLSPFLSPRVEWILSAADPQTLGEESPTNAIKFLGQQGLRELAIYLRDCLNVISEDLTGCIPQRLQHN